MPFDVNPHKPLQLISVKLQKPNTRELLESSNRQPGIQHMAPLSFSSPDLGLVKVSVRPVVTEAQFNLSAFP